MIRISAKSLTPRPISFRKQNTSFQKVTTTRSNQHDRNFKNGFRSFSTWDNHRVSTRLIDSTSTMNSWIGIGLGLLAFSLLEESDDAQAAEAPDASLAQSTVVTLNPSANVKEVAKACANLPTIVKNISDDSGKSNVLSPLMAGVAFGTQTWEKLCKQTNQGLPISFGHFVARTPGKYGGIPATGGDILLHVKGETQSLLFETVKQFVDQLPPGSVAKVEDRHSHVQTKLICDRYGFQFQDGRDLSGFIDGTENPSEAVERRAAALLPSGGSYVIHQKWIHDLKKLHSLPVEAQEQKIGREKPDSAELSPIPPSSHVARTRDDKGKKIPIVRQSMPFGNVGGEHGLLFIAYSNSPSKFDLMLDRMVGKGGPADEVMFFSNCVASQYFYCPSVAELQKLGK